MKISSEWTSHERLHVIAEITNMLHENQEDDIREIHRQIVKVNYLASMGAEDLEVNRKRLLEGVPNME